MIGDDALHCIAIGKGAGLWFTDQILVVKLWSRFRDAPRRVYFVNVQQDADVGGDLFDVIEISDADLFDDDDRNYELNLLLTHLWEFGRVKEDELLAGDEVRPECLAVLGETERCDPLLDLLTAPVISRGNDWIGTVAVVLHNVKLAKTHKWIIPIGANRHSRVIIENTLHFDLRQ